MAGACGGVGWGNGSSFLRVHVVPLPVIFSDILMLVVATKVMVEMIGVSRGETRFMVWSLLIPFLPVFRVSFKVVS